MTVSALSLILPLVQAALLPREYHTTADHVRKSAWETCTHARTSPFSFSNADDVNEFLDHLEMLASDLDLGSKAPDCARKMREAVGQGA